MGTRKICIAVNKRAPHHNTPCNRLWAAVYGLCPPSRVSAQRGHLGGGEGQFRGSILVQPAKDLSSIKMQNRENKGEEEKSIENQAYQK